MASTCDQCDAGRARHARPSTPWHPDRHVTIEIKTAVGSPNSIIQRIRTARWQARHVVVDLRGTGTTREAAAAGLAAALDMYGMHLDEVVIIVTDNLAIGWAHG